MPTRLSLALLALAFLMSAAGLPRPAAAQMVPRMVSYPRTSTAVTPCAPELQSAISVRRTVRYDARSWSETASTFEGPGCAPESTLFTERIGGDYDAARTQPWVVTYRTITPTQIGAAYLQQQCAGYAWAAGVAQKVTADSCGSIAFLRTR
jgi:hypothetical protein